MSNHEYRPYGSHLHVENAPFFSLTQDINGNPAALWKQFDKKGEILAVIDNEWSVVYPANQCVPESGDGIHIMWSIRDPRQFHTPQTLDVERLSAGMRLALQFISLPNGVAGYNISKDSTLLIQDARRKPTPQTWNNLHIHGLVLPQHAQVPPNTRKADSPVEPIILEEVFREFFSTFSYHGLATHVNPETNESFDFPTSDKSMLKLKADITPEGLATLSQEIDWLYGAFHRELFSCYVENYVSVSESGWQEPYKLLSKEEMCERIELAIPAGDKQKKLLRLYAQLLREKESDVNSEKRIYKSPSYSVALYTQNGHPYFVIHPHLIKNMNVLGTLGFRLDRTTVENAIMDKRHTRTSALLRQYQQEWGITLLPSFLD